MKTMGVDPGGARAGWAVHDDQTDSWTTGWFSPADGISRAMQLRSIAQEIGDVAAKQRPSRIGIETVFVGDHRGKMRSRQTALKIAEVRGGILTALAFCPGVIHDVVSGTAKKALTGNGHADKDMVLLVARRLLKNVDLTQDEADAVAVAVAVIGRQSEVPF